MVTWVVRFQSTFEAEFEGWSEAAKEELLAQASLLERFGPELGRPRADTLEDSAYANMKELRFSAENCEWRVAYAFDPRRQAILLVGGSKSGVSKRRFYKTLIKRADARFKKHLASLKP